MAKIINLQSGKIAVVTPWNAQIIAEAKARMGQWKRIGGDAEVSGGNAWVVDATHREHFEALIAELFPPRAALIERVVEFEANNYQTESPKVDGYDLVGFSRDRYWWKRFDGGEPVEIVHVQVDEISTGGSRNNPRLYGKATVRLRCRPQAVATWQNDGKVEVIQ